MAIIGINTMGSRQIFGGIMKFWKYYRMGKFIIEKIKRESALNHCGYCFFSFGGQCEIYGGRIYGYLRKDECKKEVG